MVRGAMALEMDLLAEATAIVLWVLAISVLVVLVTGLAGVVRLGWRLLRGEDEFVPGGSWGKQMTTRVERKRRRKRDRSLP